MQQPSMVSLGGLGPGLLAPPPMMPALGAPGAGLPAMPGGMAPPGFMLPPVPGGAWGTQAACQLGTAGAMPGFGGALPGMGGLPTGACPMNPALGTVASPVTTPQEMDSTTNPTLAALLANPGNQAQAQVQLGMPQPGVVERHQDERQRPARRGESREQVENRERLAQAEKMKCHLHKKMKPGCKFCQKHQDLVSDVQKRANEAEEAKSRDRGRRGRKPDRAISEDRDADSRRGPVELASTKTYGFSGLLQTHIVECAHFKSLLTLETFEQLMDETYQFANSVEPYMANSNTLPSALFCCLYRFFTLGLDSRQLRRLIESQESPYIRCLGLLYVRFGLPHDQLLGWLTEYLLDDEEFKPSPDSEWRTTVGEYVENLLREDKYYNTVLPRLPMVTKRQVEEKLAPLPQNRKRMKANKEIIDTFKDPGTKVECNIAGEWLRGTLIELEEDVPTRPKIRARLDDGSEEYVHLGKVILAGGGQRGRSRSRGRRERSRSPHVDWCRDKGRSDKDLIDEMRSREREKAVCSTGKDYARKPVGYKAACALPREQGAASYRLMEEETFVPMSRQKRARTPSPESQHYGRRPSAEHQARMQQLFEKYSTSKSSGEDRRQDDGVDRPDMLRLG